jgi:hypothetical protein
MAKNILTVIIFFIANAVLSQTIQIKGTVKDTQSKETLGYANVSTEDQLHGTISNEEGVFILSCPETTKKIIISYMGYAPLEIATEALPQDGIYLMDIQDVMLDELIVIDIPYNKFIKKLIDTSTAKLTAPLLLSTYYREFVKINEKYTKFSDALIEYNMSRKRKDIDTDVVVKQSRAARLVSEDDESIDMMSGFDVRKAVSKDCNFTGIERVLLNDKNYESYNFLIKSQQLPNGQQIEIITIEPKEEVHEALFKGTIAYNPKNNLILDVNLYMAESHKQYIKERNFLIIRASLEDIVYKSSFKTVDDKYLLSYSSRYGIIHIRNKKTYNDDLMFKSDLIVTNFSSDLTSFNKKEKYRDKALYERGNKYTENFWLKNNSIVLTAQEEQIIKSLENKQ